LKKRRLPEGNLWESVYAMPGPPIGKELIELRIVYDSSSWIMELPAILRERGT
jgi:hypothetical protein